MRNKFAQRAWAFILTLSMTLSCLSPTLAFAASSSVRVEDHNSEAEAAPLHSISIGSVDAPEVGDPLDDVATVSSAEGTTWEIPVLWIDSELQLATEASEGRTLLPALAFYFPTGYTAGDVDITGSYEIALDESVVKLFGTSTIISIYDESTGITYILPSTLKGFFAPSQDAAPTIEDDGEATEPQEVTDSETQPTPSTPTTESEQDGEKTIADLIDVYCSETAKSALSQEDLEYLIDLILNRLQPQAVELLRSKFPAFDDAADNGGIGTRLSLYIYYKTGDKDGDESHEGADNSTLAYVMGRPLKGEDGRAKYVYMLAVNAAQIVKTGEGGVIVLDRDGKAATDFENTLVHELFHAYMDDYNRTGMVGATNEDEMIFDLKHVTDAQGAIYGVTHYPTWFIEGTASAVENVYQYRNGLFSLLRSSYTATNPDGSTHEYPAGSVEAVFGHYVGTVYDNEYIGYSLLIADRNVKDNEGNDVSQTPSRYVSGYLAVVYLGELAARANGSSAVSTTSSGKTTFSSEKIRMGLNSILERMHKGETLDQVIASISPKDAKGKPIYTDTSSFEQQFVSGLPNKNERYQNPDMESLTFVTKFLNYMHAIDEDTSRTYGANGSILFDFDRDFGTPLDRLAEASSDLFKIIESNTYVESTVPNSTALSGGGRSRSGSSALSAAADLEAESVEALPLAAKSIDDATAADSGVPASTSEQEDATAATQPTADESEAEDVPAASQPTTGETESKDEASQSTTDGSEAVAAQPTTDTAESANASDEVVKTRAETEAVDTSVEPTVADTNTEATSTAPSTSNETASSDVPTSTPSHQEASEAANESAQNDVTHTESTTATPETNLSTNVATDPSLPPEQTESPEASA